MPRRLHDREALPSCSAASIASVIDGAPTAVAASEHVALEVDIVQYDNGEGPCLAALDGEDPRRHRRGRRTIGWLVPVTHPRERTSAA